MMLSRELTGAGGGKGNPGSGVSGRPSNTDDADLGSERGVGSELAVGIDDSPMAA